MHMKMKMSAMTIMIGILLILSGCGLWGSGEQADNNDDNDKTINFVEEGESLDQQQNNDKDNNEGNDQAGDEKMKEDDDKQTGAVHRKLFLVDKNGMIAPQTLSLPETKSEAKQSLQ